MDEVRLVEWVDPATGLRCMVLPSPLGTNNGYVELPVLHPRHGQEMEEFHDLRVHGGVTHAGGLLDFDGWWVGFDTMHLGDKVPGSPRGTFRTVQYVQNEVTQLARQLGPAVPRNWIAI